jgi:hypothetical protein
VRGGGNADENAYDTDINLPINGKNVNPTDQKPDWAKKKSPSVEIYCKIMMLSRR